MSIVCGWCGQKAQSGSPCPHCRRDPVLPWFQRATEPPVWVTPTQPRGADGRFQSRTHG